MRVQVKHKEYVYTQATYRYPAVIIPLCGRAGRVEDRAPIVTRRWADVSCIWCLKIKAKKGRSK